MEVVGFNHDDLADGSGKAPFTLGLKYLTNDSIQMNKSDITDGGFFNSSANNYLFSLYNHLPESLQKYVKKIKKFTTVPNSNYSATYIDDVFCYLFLFSAPELGFVSNALVNGSEGFPYTRFDDTPTSVLMKKCVNEQGFSDSWWTRSLRDNYNSDTDFLAIDSEGRLTWYNASLQCRLCFGFCI